MGVKNAPVDTSWIIDSPPTQVYKSDRRSRVWRIDTPIGPLVIKRFEQSRWRQHLWAWAGAHPAQREARKIVELQRARLPVVPVIAHGSEQGRRWLVTRWVGRSLHNTIQQHVREQTQPDPALLQRARGLARQIDEAGFYHRDFKASNLLVDHERLWLIDVGDVRQRCAKGLARMQDQLEATLEDARTRPDESAPTR